MSQVSYDRKDGGCQAISGVPLTCTLVREPESPKAAVSDFVRIFRISLWGMSSTPFDDTAIQRGLGLDILTYIVPP